jgi:hypothetical protein
LSGEEIILTEVRVIRQSLLKIENHLKDSTMTKVELQRQFSPDQTAITADTVPATSTAVDYRAWALGELIVPTGAAATTITFMTSATAAGTYADKYKSDNTVLTLVVEGDRNYDLPSELASAHFFKMKTNAGTLSNLVVLTKG